MTYLNKYISVLWEDAWNGNSSYYTTREINEETPLILECVGYCIRHNKEGISMASTLPSSANGTQYYRHVQHIPHSMIRKVRELKFAKT